MALNRSFTIIDFGELYSQYRPRFVVVARRYVRDVMVAEDLVEDSFISFWENYSRLERDVNIPAYILTIVKNKSLNWLAAQQRHMRIEKQIHTTQSRMIEYSISSLDMCDPNALFVDEISMIIDKELRAMPELTRLVFEASRFSSKTYSEIADENGISVRRVTSEIQSALSILRKSLKDYLPSAVISLILNGLYS